MTGKSRLETTRLDSTRLGNDWGKQSVESQSTLLFSQSKASRLRSQVSRSQVGFSRLQLAYDSFGWLIDQELYLAIQIMLVLSNGWLSPLSMSTFRRVSVTTVPIRPAWILMYWNGWSLAMTLFCKSTFWLNLWLGNWKKMGIGVDSVDLA